MTKIRIINKHFRLTALSFIVYFCFDFLVYNTGFIKAYSFVGFKSFLPTVLGLNFGIYGVLGEALAVALKAYIIKPNYRIVIMEYIIIIVMGIGIWFLWHMRSLTHRIHFRHILNYIRYILIVLFLSAVCGLISKFIVNPIAYRDIIVWNSFMSILVGIPIEIIFASLMNLEPILPPLYIDGKRIVVEDDFVYTIDNKSESLLECNEKLEQLLMREKVDMKRSFEIQNLVEEIYLRILKKIPNAVIDVRTNYDITFSVEFIYISKKYNPFKTLRDDEEADLVGLRIIKHRALLSFYDYNYGLNTVRVVY